MLLANTALQYVTGPAVHSVHHGVSQSGGDTQSTLFHGDRHALLLVGFTMLFK